jgi:CBS domain-containing protein
MGTDRNEPQGDEAYYDEHSTARGFDASLLEQPLHTLPTRHPLVYRETDSVTQAMRDMQRKRRGCVLITEDGTGRSKLLGIFSERDVLLRVVDRGRNPATLPLRDVMTADPECLPQTASIAWVLNKMAVGGFRHVPVLDEHGCPVRVVSVRDVVQFLVEFFPSEILNLPPEFRPPRSLEREGA